MAVASIVDYLKSKGQDSSYNNRKNLASQYGITNYAGTAAQNTNLLRALQSGSKGSAASPQATNQATTGSNVTITPVNNASAENKNSQYLTGYQYQKYTPSDRVNSYADKLADLEDDKPGAYVSKYDSQIDSIVNSILNRQQFDPNSVYDTDLYKNYREQYMQQGNKAMRDTIGNISGMTGGYGSTYATAAGQQAYDNYMSQLGDKTMDIYDRVYQQYLNEGQELYNQLGMVNNQDSIDYSRYRDTVNDYYNDLNYYAGRYDSTYAQDFGEYQYNQDAQRWQRNTHTRKHRMHWRSRTGRHSLITRNSRMHFNMRSNSSSLHCRLPKPGAEAGEGHAAEELKRVQVPRNKHKLYRNSLIWAEGHTTSIAPDRSWKIMQAMQT